MSRRAVERAVGPTWAENDGAKPHKR